jgi:hypothetical protein
MVSYQAVDSKVAAIDAQLEDKDEHLIVRSWGIHRTRVAKDHLIVITWFLRGPRGSDTLARVLQRVLGESADSSIPRETLEESSKPCFTFRT